MQKKILAILSSVRFWILTLTAILAVLEELTMGSLSLEFLFGTVQVWLLAVVSLGTLDSVATKFGNK